MTNRFSQFGHWCARTLARTWFLMTESDPPEPPKPGIRVFGPAKPRTPHAEAVTPRKDA